MPDYIVIPADEVENAELEKLNRKVEARRHPERLAQKAVRSRGYYGRCIAAVAMFSAAVTAATYVSSVCAALSLILASLINWVLVYLDGRPLE